MERASTDKHKLTLLEYVWSCWPLIMAFVGGALGGLCGGVAAAVSIKIFNSSRDPRSKYTLSFLVSLASVALYLLAVAALLFAFR
ncbi:MAG: hypothetical protein ACTS5I_06690 [Rhodanobacter sp.]